MNVTICIGSSCHIKGSRKIVNDFQSFIAEYNIGDEVKLGGTFCMGECQQGVCVTIDDEFFSVSPENSRDFFDREILKRVRK